MIIIFLTSREQRNIVQLCTKKYSNPKTANYRVRGAKDKDRREISFDRPMLVFGCIFKGGSRNY